MMDVSAQLADTGIRGARLPGISTSVKSRAAFAFGALLATLFALSYAGLIALAGWGAYAAAAGTSPARACLTLCGATLLILPLLKPLIARPEPGREPHALDPGEQPLLFAFVRELAMAAGIPEPSGIAVDCNVNCCCILSGGFTGLFDSQYALVIGLPLVAALRLDQFAGILAHELSHRAYTAALGSSRLIWSINAWFNSRAFEPDEIDERLRARRANAGPVRRIAIGVLEGLVSAGRGVLRLVRIVEQAVTAPFLRNMELQADRWQVSIAGSAAFVSTVSELNLLSVAAQRALVELSRKMREGQIVNDYPNMIASICSGYSADFRGRLLAGLETAKTGIFPAHPCDRDRIRMARAQASAGMVPAGLPATILFRDFRNLCCEVTLEFYRQEFGLTNDRN